MGIFWQLEMRVRKDPREKEGKEAKWDKDLQESSRASLRVWNEDV